MVLSNTVEGFMGGEENDDMTMFDVREVTSKCVLLSCMGDYVAVPLVNTFS